MAWRLEERGDRRAVTTGTCPAREKSEATANKHTKVFILFRVLEAVVDQMREVERKSTWEIGFASDI
jgi:hypothetical protein